MRDMKTVTDRVTENITDNCRAVRKVIRKNTFFSQGISLIRLQISQC